MSGPLVHSPATVLRTLVINLGLGTLPSAAGSWPVYVSNEPDNPDETITLYDTAHWIHGRTQVDGETQQHHGVQFRVRASHPSRGFQKCWEIATAVDTLVNRSIVNISAANIGLPTAPVVIPGASYRVDSITRYQRIGTTGFLYLGKERTQAQAASVLFMSNRDIFSLNVKVAVRQVS